MALWEVVSEDKAGEAPSVSFREVRHKSLRQRRRRSERVDVRPSCLFEKY